jgi:hypothetical protein
MGLDLMKEKEPLISLSEIAAMSLGDFAYDPDEPDEGKPAIHKADEACDCTNGGGARNGFTNPFADLDVPRIKHKASASSILATRVGAYLTHRTSD